METSTVPLSSVNPPLIVINDGEPTSDPPSDVKLFTVDDISSEEAMSQVSSINVNEVKEDSTPTKPRLYREAGTLPGLLGSKSDVYLRMSLNISAFMARIGGQSNVADASTSRLENLILNGSPSVTVPAKSLDNVPVEPERMVVMLEEVEQEFFQEVDLSDPSATIPFEDRIAMSYLADPEHHLRCPSEIILEEQDQKKKKRRRVLTMIAIIGTVVIVTIIIIVIGNFFKDTIYILNLFLDINQQQ